MQSVLKKFVRIIAAFIVVVLAVSQWFGTETDTASLNFDVNHLTAVSWFETPYFYLFINLFVLSLPLLLSFDRKVHFYKKWPAVAAAIVITALLFIPWDIVFTRQAIWGFNPEYYLDQYRLMGLPLEEWMFFVTVPYACIFIYECLNYYVRTNWFSRYEPVITAGLLVTFILIAVLFRQHTYTVVTSLLCMALLLVSLALSSSFYRGRFYMAFLVSLIPFFLVNGALTGALTLSPVVVYNDALNISIRLITIPLDDVFYAFLLLGMNISLFEFFVRRRHPARAD